MQVFTRFGNKVTILTGALKRSNVYVVRVCYDDGEEREAWIGDLRVDGGAPTLYALIRAAALGSGLGKALSDADYWTEGEA